jgi:transposase
MSRQGTFYFKKQTHAFNIETFFEFVKEVLNKFEELNLHERTIIMDNVRFHHSSRIIILITSKCHRVIFIPPYSPFLNPI